MNRLKGLVANIDRCIGCYACEVACKQENSLPAGEKWIRVRTLGPYVVKGELAMDFVPLATDDCDFCHERVGAGGRPFCAEVCPTQALDLYTEEQMLGLLRSASRIQICRMGT